MRTPRRPSAGCTVGGGGVVTGRRGYGVGTPPTSMGLRGAARHVRSGVTAIVMDGNALRDETGRSRLRARSRPPARRPMCLATVLVGDDPPSQRYVRSKQRKATEAGLQSAPRRPAGHRLAGTGRGRRRRAGGRSRRARHPRPAARCPTGLDPEAVLALIPPEKDVDGLTERSMGRLVRGVPGLVGCTPLGVMRLLERYGVETAGRRAVVVGRSHARRPAAGAAARPQGRRRHGHDRPLPDGGPGRRVPGGRHPRRRRRPGPHDHRRPRQAGCGRHRRRACRAPRPASSATSTGGASPRSPGG